MDKSSSPETGSDAPGKTWNYSGPELLDLIKSHDSISNIRITTPYYFNAKDGDFFKADKNGSMYSNCYNMVLGLNRQRLEKVVFFLEMRLGGILMNKNYLKNTGFYYRYIKKHNPLENIVDEIVITRHLGTRDPETIKEQANILFKESRSFYLKYFEIPHL